MLLGWTINQQRCRLNIKAQFLYNSRHLRSLLGLLPKKGQKLRRYINIQGQRARAVEALMSPINQRRCRCNIISTVYRCWGVKRGTHNNGPKNIGKYDDNRVCPIPWHFFSPSRLATIDLRNKWQLGLIPSNLYCKALLYRVIIVASMSQINPVDIKLLTPNVKAK